MSADVRAGGECRGLVYGEVHGSLVFIGERLAREQALIYEVLASARTWGELRRRLPAEVHAEMLALREGEGGSPDDGEAFDAGDFDPYTEGDWPPWPAQLMLDWMPERVKALGSSEASAISGDSLWLEPRLERDIVGALEGEGFTCRRDDDLVLRASHGS
jgi:hypothetical protein